MEKALSIIKKILGGAMYAIFGIICVIVLWLSIDKFILGSPVPSFLGYSTLTVETGSMSGTLEIGDMIVIKDTGEYKIGDIVTYLHEGEKIPTTHRIINYSGDNFVTKGDFNNTKDTVDVRPDEILGEVVMIIPDVGIFAEWVRIDGWIYIVAVLAILGLGLLVLNFDDQKSEDDEDEDKESDTKNDSDDNTPADKEAEN